MNMLKDNLDWDNILIQPRTAQGHTEILDVLFKNAKVICSFKEDTKRGDIAYVYKLNKEYIIVSDFFGSCRVCDVYAQANDKELKNLCIQLANNAYRFKTMKDLFHFLKNIIDNQDVEYYDLFEIAEGLFEELTNNRKVLRAWKLSELFD